MNLAALLGRRAAEDKQRVPERQTAGARKKEEPAAPEKAPPGQIYVQEKWDAVQVGHTWHQVFQVFPPGEIQVGYAQYLLLNASLALKGRTAWLAVEVSPGDDFTFNWFTRQRLKRIELTTLEESAEIGALIDDREAEAALAIRELWEANRMRGEPLSRWRIFAGVQAPTYEAVKRAGEELRTLAEGMGFTIRLMTGQQWQLVQRFSLGFTPNKAADLKKGRVAPLRVSAGLVPIVGGAASDSRSREGHPLIYCGHTLSTSRRVRLDLFSGVQDSNMVVSGKTGSGKSTYLKALLQSLRQAGCRTVVLDLDGEGLAQCQRMKGVWMDLSATTGRYIDPLLLPPPVPVPDWMPSHHAENIIQWNQGRLNNAIESVMGFLAILLGEQWRKIPEYPAIAHESIRLTLKKSGIDLQDQRTWDRRCTMLDWWKTLKEYASRQRDPRIRDAARFMVMHLSRYFEDVTALFREPVSLADADALWIHMAGAMGQTSADDKAASAKMQLALTTLWAITVQERVRGERFTALFFDEGQRLLTNPEAARTVASLVTGVRKFNAMTILATNMPQVFWENDGGRAAWQNSSYLVLFGLEDSALREIRVHNPDRERLPDSVLERLAHFGHRGSELAHAFMFRHPVLGWEECILKLPEEELALYATRGLKRRQEQAADAEE